MRSRAEWLLPLAAVALGGAAPAQDQSPQPFPADSGTGPRGTSQLAPGEERHDQVGYAVAYQGAAPGGITAFAAHPALAAGSFVEVTALDSGRTILLGVTAQAPAPAGAIVALSPVAAAQLGLDLSTRAPVRVRAVQPTAQDEAALARGGAASTRLDAPPALLKGLRAMLPKAATPTSPPAAMPATPRPTSPPPAATPAPKPATAPAPKPAAARPAPTGKFVVQVGTFSNAASARSLAKRLGGFTDSAGRFTRVRLGPFATRGDADKARAKAAAAGYRDAAIITAD